MGKRTQQFRWKKPTTFDKCWSAKALPTKCRFIVAQDTVSPVRPGATRPCGRWHFSKNTSAILQEVSDKQVGGTSNCIHPYTISEELQEVIVLTFLLWCFLFVMCWPVALLALVLYPFIWLLLLPFRLVGIAVHGVLALFSAAIMLPARLLSAPFRI